MLTQLELSEEMYKNGYKKITNIDISSVIISKMKDNYKASIPDMLCTFA